MLVEDNKRELFQFLTSYVRDNFQPCNHEEADSRMFVHAYDAARNGYKKLLIRTVDTDVAVLAITNFAKLGVDELWVGYGLGKHLKNIPAHIILSNLGIRKSQALTGFHSFTGCDSVSCT